MLILILESLFENHNIKSQYCKVELVWNSIELKQLNILYFESSADRSKFKKGKPQLGKLLSYVLHHDMKSLCEYENLSTNAAPFY